MNAIDARTDSHRHDAKIQSVTKGGTSAALAEVPMPFMGMDFLPYCPGCPNCGSKLDAFGGYVGEQYIVCRARCGWNDSPSADEIAAMCR